MGLFDVYEKKPKRNLFPLSHRRVQTFQDFGVLYPILCKPLMPADVIQHRHSINLQFMPMSANVNHSFRINTYYFFVPNRILYDNWDEVMTRTPDAALPVMPFMTEQQWLAQNHEYAAIGSLSDYLGLCCFELDSSGSYASAPYATNRHINTMPHRAYFKIWFDYFRDEESTSTGDLDTNGSQESAVQMERIMYLYSKAWQKDPFTTSLFYRIAGNNMPQISSTFTIEDFRNANSLTKFFERINRSGRRPQEFIHATYGVKPKDYRLDMPEFLCASQSQIILGQVLNHDASGSGLTQAQGYSVSTARTSAIAGGFKYRCREFGWLLGLAVIVPEAVYMQMMPRWFTNFEQNTDYPLPDFAHVGDQGIKEREFHYAFPSTVQLDAQNDTVFGYAPRYWEHKYWMNEICGQFKKSSYWDYHDARIISQPQNRIGNFVYIASNVNRNGQVRVLGDADPWNLKRIFTVSSTPATAVPEPIAYMDIYHDFKGLRPMPYSSLPRL